MASVLQGATLVLAGFVTCYLVICQFYIDQLRSLVITGAGFQTRHLDETGGLQYDVRENRLSNTDMTQDRQTEKSLHKGLESQENTQTDEFKTRIKLPNKYPQDLIINDYRKPERSVVPTLKPAKHIAFLKVHKAASSTIQNIFLRFGLKHNLVFVLPVNGYTISLQTSVEVVVNVYPPPRNKSFDILCNHVIYNRVAFEKAMPRDTIYIGTVREPFSQFVSNVMYSHVRHIMKIEGPRPLLKFLNNPGNYLARTGSSKVPITYNRMARDFGFPLRLFDDDSDENRINRYLYKLDKEFDLVIVTEYFDESMVLMRRILNWKLEDVLYLRHKQRNKSRIVTGNEEKILYRKWARLDHKLYNFFVRRLLRTIRLLGTDFQQELFHYRFVRNLFNEFCEQGVNTNQTKNSLIIEKSVMNEKFVILKTHCDQIRKQPRAYYSIISKEQYGIH